MSDTNVLEAPAPGAEDTCTNCGTPKKDSKVGWCQRCGFYPRLGTFVELDPWDKEPESTAATEPQPKHTNLLKMVPPWGWKLFQLLAAIVVVSIFGRLVTPAGSSARTAWALLQLGGGVLVFIIGHLSCYVFVIMETDKFNVLDIVLKPFAIWARVIQDLPVSFKRVAITSGGLMAAVTAMAIVGGIPYEKLWDWGIAKRAKTNLVQAIADAARQAEGNQDGLDKAIEDFAGKATDALAETPKPAVDERKLSAECVIAGYVPSGDDFQALVLVSEVNGRVRCVGVVRDGIPPEVQAELNRRLRQIERLKPFVPCQAEGAVWGRATAYVPRKVQGLDEQQADDLAGLRYDDGGD